MSKAIKGKDERGLGYVKHNAIAGRSFASWGALETHLAEVADTRQLLAWQPALH